MIFGDENKLAKRMLAILQFWTLTLALANTGSSGLKKRKLFGEHRKGTDSCFTV